jgi:Ca2+-binding RTX toxin-like protein
VIWANNITYNGTPGDASVRTDGGNAAPLAANGNKLGIDPRLADAPADFNPRAGSPAIDAGSARYGVAAEDLDGGDRTIGPVDIGAYESGSGSRGRVVTGTDGADKVDGGSGNDTVLGLDGNDRLSGGPGSDLLNGAGGTDTVVYSGSTAFKADLSNFGPQTTGQGKDTLIDIENVRSGSGNDTLKGNSGTNVIEASGGNDRLSGGAGNDRLTGGSGDDYIDGGTGTDTAVYAGSTPVTVTLASKLAQQTGAGRDTIIGIENLVSGSGNDMLTGDSGNNSLSAGAGHDSLGGGGGNDWLYGGEGSDTLSGGRGSDVFVFDTMAISSNLDRITDFSANSDIIRLENSIFAALPTGSLSSGAFVANSSGKAGDASDRIIYETDTGSLYYDKDGNGPERAIRIAVLDAGLFLTSDCFAVI